MTYDYENLQYGTIYCTAPLPEEIMKEIPSFYNIEYIEKQNDENIIFARCINIGCINNPYAIVSYTFGENEEKFRNFKRFAKRLGDFLDFSFYGQEYSSYGGRPRISGTDSTHNDEKDDNESEGVEISILGEECDEPKFCPVDAKIEQERNEILNRISIFLEEYLKKHNKMPNITEIKDATGTQQILLGIPDNPMTSPEGTTLYSLTPSPVWVDKDMRIMLEDWGYELKLPPQHKVLYIFFLKHTNGIRLKDIKKYI
ncbi:MAG: hypothetical protein IKR52_06280, partial [Paludibacteraceae bacterium]|nr:hypothetical protein [Paludibacteraceae bacterium]